jgi:SAM-dependent methyltransferase
LYSLRENLARCAVVRDEGRMADAVGKRFFPEIEAGGFSRLDGTVQFYQRINALIRPDAVVMDYGAGRGASQTDDPAQFRRHLVTLKGRVRELIGADVDPAVKSNASLDRAILVGPDGRLPLPDASIDVIVSDFTFEHVQDPASVARELDRVLVGGVDLRANAKSVRIYRTRKSNCAGAP